MGFSISKIVEAWSISFNPNDKQKELAEKRWSICETCPHKVETFKNKEWSYICGACGCPLKKKVFTNEYDACPKGFWADVEKEYLENNNKTMKTLI